MLESHSHMAPGRDHKLRKLYISIPHTPMYYSDEKLRGDDSVDLMQELIRPTEPEDMLKELIAFKKHLQGNRDVDWDSDSEAIWFRNRIPSYLWKNWKHTLTKAGFTWPRFLKHMRNHTFNMGCLLDKQIDWVEFTDRLKKTLDEDTKRRRSTD